LRRKSSADHLKTRPWIIEPRRETVEHPFGTIKQWMNEGAFLTRDPEKVRAEFNLTSLVYDLLRALNILGMSISRCRRPRAFALTRSFSSCVAAGA
jgi:hypothetical protein